MNKLFTLFTLLLLLPLAARAAAPSTLTVGGTTITSSGYWTTNADGTLTAEGASADNYNVHYDGNGTLTLKDANITGDSSTNFSAGIHAGGDLTIVLEGSSTVTGVVINDGSQGIRVSGNLTIQGDGSLTAQGADTSGGGSCSYGMDVDGSFTQQGGSVTATAGNVNGNNPSSGLNVSGTVTVKGGTLTATGGSGAKNSSYGISAYSSVTVSDATVTATSGSAEYASYGLYIGSSSPSVTLSGSSSLTARSGSATDKAGGIYLDNIRGSAGSVTVGNGSTLLANSVILRASSDEKPLAPTGDGSWLIYGQNDQPSAVGGTYTLTDDLTIENGNTFTIPAGSTLTVPQGKTLTVDGTLNIANQSSLAGEGTLAGNGNFYLTNPDPVISGSETLTYDGTDQSDKFTLTAPSGTVQVMGQAFNISDTPSTDGWSLDKLEIKDAGSYTLTASHGTSTIEKEVTVNPATISITSATVQDKTYDGNQDATVTGVEFTGLVNSESLSLGTDYTATATFTDANAGESKNATVTVTLKNGNYTFADNQDEATYDSATGTISPLHVVLEWDYQSPFTYNGETHVVTATVTNMVGEDEITLTYEGNTGTAVSSYTAKVTGLDNTNYTLEGVENTTLNWEIVGASIAEATVALSEITFTYTGSEQKPEVTALTLDEKALTEDIDYTVDYSDESINAGEYTVTVTGTGNYSGTVTATYTINKADQAALSITSNGPATYGQNYTLTTSGGSGDGAVIFTVTDETGAATVNDNILTPTKAGSVTVTATKAGDNNYNDVTSDAVTITINKVTYDGTKTASGSVLASHTDFVTLPDIPDGASYGDPNTSDDLTDLAITGSTLSYTGGSSVTSGGTYTITVPVTGATNYVDYTITVTLTGKEIVTVEAEGSKNPSFSTSQDRFTLTATIRVDDGSLAPTTNSWTWAVADDDVAALSGSPTLRNVSVSSSDQTFEIKGPGTTTITATYDDGTYRGSVDFTVRISKPTTPDPDPISYYNIYVEDVCDGVEVTTSKNVVREGNSISVYVEKDTAHYTFDNFHVYYKEGYYGPWVELPEGVQPGEYPIKNIWNHIYIKAEGAEEKEDPTGIEQIEGVKVYAQDGNLYVYTSQLQEVTIITMNGVIVKRERQEGWRSYSLPKGIYIIGIGEERYKVVVR